MSTECAVRGMPCGLPFDESISTAMNASPSSRRSVSNRASRHRRVVGEAEPEEARALRGALLHPREVGVADADATADATARPGTAATAG